MGDELLTTFIIIVIHYRFIIPNVSVKAAPSWH